MTTTKAPVTALSQVVAANVRAEAARRGWTQGELARRLNLSRMTISDRYRERTPWTVDELDRLAQEMGIEAGDLLARPKGFEPLTFWLGANHTLTAWWSLDPRWVGDVQGEAGYRLFCDDCGFKVRWVNGWPAPAAQWAETHAVEAHPETVALEGLPESLA